MSHSCMVPTSWLDSVYVITLDIKLLFIFYRLFIGID